MSTIQPMRIHFLSVGQADAIVIELPSGRLAIVDFGHKALLPYLAALDPTRSRRFAFCLLTHPHDDHYLSLGDFIANYDTQVEEYWFSFSKASLFGGNGARIPQLDAFRRAIIRGARGVKFAGRVPLIKTLESGLTATVFPPNEVDELALSANALSVVLLLEYGGAAVLLGADAGASRWRRILKQGRAAARPVMADVVKAPHHGATPPEGIPADLWPQFLRSPMTYVVFSTGNSSMTKPAPSTIDALRGGCQIRCTGRAAICAPLASSATPPIVLPSDSTDLYESMLVPAPEVDTSLPSCFGTQVYEIAPTGTVTPIRWGRPAFLDACRTVSSMGTE